MTSSLSKIDEFLAEQSSEGSSDGSGGFSLAPDKALQKIAQYQRAFPEVWLVKVIQAAVVGASEAIRVKLTRQETIIEFSLPGLSPERLETAFHEPKASGDEALDHLLLGLWYVALGRDYPFTLSFPHYQTSLRWDGDRFHRSAAGAGSTLTLRVSHLRVGQVCGWLARRRVVAERCLELGRCLDERCYTCPVPLTVDGRRIDTLLKGFPVPGTATIPFFHDLIPVRSLPDWTVPQGSYETAQETQTASIVWTGFVGFEARESFWHGVPTHGGLSWVLDGVVIHRETLPIPTRVVSLEILVSAEGLATDVSGFRLVKNDQLSRRRKTTYATTLGRLKEAKPEFRNALSVLKAKDARPSRVLPTVGGVILLPVMPPLGLLLLSMAWTTKEDKEAVVHLLRQAESDWTHLQWDLGASLPGI